MRTIVIGLAVAAVACGPKPDAAPPADTTTAVAPAPPPVSLSSFAGRWRVVGRNEATNDSLITYELTATADTAGWTILLPGQTAPIPVRVALQGSEVRVDAGPYPSVLRKGVQVTTDAMIRLEGDSLVGSTTAHYSAGPDSVLRLRTVGKRITP